LAGAPLTLVEECRIRMDFERPWPLEVALRERGLDPLGMDDTAFHVHAGELDRVGTAYMVDTTDAFSSPLATTTIQTSGRRRTRPWPEGDSGQARGVVVAASIAAAKTLTTSPA
jgi:CubicO group peptidase (beta-lactamase class C family)